MKTKIALPKFSIWHIILLFLIMAIITWWWFDRQIGSIDSQIEFMHK